MKRTKIQRNVISIILYALIIIVTCATSAYATTFHADQEAVDVARQYVGGDNPSSSGQCKGFVEFVYKKAFDISIPNTAADGGQWLPWCDDVNIVAHYDSGSANEKNSQYDDMTSFFQSICPGDAIQMSGDPYPHTMIVSEVHWDNWCGFSSVSVVDANWSADYDNQVREHALSLDDLTSFMTDAGMTAYRYRYATN